MFKMKIPVTLIALVFCNLLEVRAENSLLNEDYLGKRILPDLSAISLEDVDNKFRDDVQKFKALFDNHLGNDKQYEVTKDIPFTLIIPSEVDLKNEDETKIKDFLLDHIIPGILVQIKNDTKYGSLNKNNVNVNMACVNQLMVHQINGQSVLGHDDLDDNLLLVFIDNSLTEKENRFNKRNIQEHNRYNEPQRLEMKNVTGKETPIKENKVGHHLMNFLSGMKSGTKVFQHFLLNSNLSQLLDDSAYTILIPSDTAFQRWHPIDWGFYPFSVHEFTESVLRNHFLRLKQPLRMGDVKNMHSEQKFKTLGGEYVIFKSSPTPNVNNVSILSDFTLPSGNEVFIISEVLFVSEAVVSRLHQMHKDKETPPLLAFPWFGAQFLSHAFLALERDNRFSQITRFLNTAEIAQFISGSNYTFFVPTDEAFERYSFDILPDDVLASEKGIKMLLNHFIKGRLYDRDLKDNEVFDTIGGGAVRIQRSFSNNVTVNNAKIIQSEVFVYNLGTMFYVDDVLYADMLKDEVSAIIDNRNQGLDADETYTTEMDNEFEKKKPTTSKISTPFHHTTSADVEIVPSEYTEQSGNEDDLLQDDEIVTPKALPVKFFYAPKK